MLRDHHQAQALQQWIETQVLADFSGRILDLTRNIKDFDGMGLRLLNLWQHAL